VSITISEADVNTQTSEVSQDDAALLEYLPNSLPLSARQRKYRLQEAAAWLVPEERVNWCSRRAHSPVEIRKNGIGGCFFHGLARCGSVWYCAVCASKIAEVRRSELQKASAAGYSMFLVTITLQHFRGDKLNELLEDLNNAWSETRSGRAWQAIEAKYQIVASCSGLENTFSQENGHHPHKHIIFYSSLPDDQLDVEVFQEELSSRWRAILQKHDHYGSEYYAVKVTKNKEEQAGYLSKWGIVEEVTKSQSKRGQEEHYSMWELLELAASGVYWARAAWLEYAAAVKGRRWLVWSKGARKLFNLDNKTDQEIAEEEPEEPPCEVIYKLSNEEWLLVRRMEKRCQLLEVAERQGAEGVQKMLFTLKKLLMQREAIEKLDAIYEMDVS